MALTKPILSSIDAFDVHDGYRFTFDVIGGDQVTGSKLSIFNNVTGALVYTGEQTRDSFYFDLPADPDYNNNSVIDLINGGNYNAYIETVGATGYSTPSSRMQFYCFAQPSFEFTGTISPVSTATNTWYLNYTNNSGAPDSGLPIDTLAEYTFTLYNGDGSQAQTSGILSTASYPNLNYTFTGLLRGTYTIKATGVTTHGMKVETQEHAVIVEYNIPEPEGIITATNICTEGYIFVQVDVNDVLNVENYQYARIYRRDMSSTEWVLLIENYITNILGGTYVHIDKYNRYGVTYEYALALVQFDGVESVYFVQPESQVYSEFDGVFLSDLTTNYKIYANTQYGGTTSVQKVGVHEPIGSKYPILVYNATTNYQKGSVTSAVLDRLYETERIFRDFNVTQQMNTLDAFLKNKQAKILKDWNGNIWLCSIVGEPSISYNNNSGMNYIECTFDWIEQGNANSYTDLYSTGLISHLPPINVKFIGLSGTSISLTNSNGDTLSAIIGETGETTITTYNIGVYSGTATLSNEFGTQIKTISLTVEGGVLNTLTIPHYNLNINGSSAVYAVTPTIHLENGDSVINTSLTGSITVPIMQIGTWSGYALAYTNQKQPISTTFVAADRTITVQEASTLTITTVSDVSYLLSNTNGGYTNTISGTGSGVYKLFTNGIWAGNSIATGNQSVSESVNIVNYATSYTLDIESAIVTFEATARLDDSVPMSVSNSGATISNTFLRTTGQWLSGASKLSSNVLTDMAYGNGYWVTCNGTDGIAYSTALDGTWTNITMTNASIVKIMYANSYWVAVDTTGKIWYRSSTPNGTWSSVTINTFYGVNDVYYGNGYWVVTVGGGAELPPSNEAGVYYRASNPAGAWTFQNLSTSTPIWGVYYNNGYWVCVDIDKSGIWYRSSNPAGAWTLKVLTISGVTTPSPNDITYGNGYWVILDRLNNGIYYTSGALSSTWSGYTDATETYIPIGSLRNILYANGYWVITYDTGSSSTSGILYRYNDINPANGFADLIKQVKSGAIGGVLLYANEFIIISGYYSFSTAPPPLYGSSNRFYYHSFPVTQPSLQSASYTVIKSGAWSGTGVIDNYTKSISFTPTLTVSGTNTYTLDIKDKGLT